MIHNFFRSIFLLCVLTSFSQNTATLYAMQNSNNVQSQERDFCQICQNGTEQEEGQSQEFVILGCHHQFHLDCIKKIIIESSFTCPTCSNPILITDEMLEKFNLSEQDLKKIIKELSQELDAQDFAVKMLFTTRLQTILVARARLEPVNQRPQAAFMQDNVLFFFLICAVLKVVFASNQSFSS